MKKLLLSALSILMLVGCAFKEQGTTIPHEQTQETEKKPVPDVRLLKQDKYDTIKLNATEDGVHGVNGIDSFDYDVEVKYPHSYYTTATTVENKKFVNYIVTNPELEADRKITLDKHTVEELGNFHISKITTGMADMSKPLFVRDDIFEVSTITMDKKDLKKGTLQAQYESWNKYLQNVETEEGTYNGYKLRVYNSKFGEDNTIISMLYLDETHMLRIDYKPEAEAKVGEKSLKEKYNLIESVLEELVKVEK